MAWLVLLSDGSDKAANEKLMNKSAYETIPDSRFKIPRRALKCPYGQSGIRVGTVVRSCHVAFGVQILNLENLESGILNLES
jgi:hypothetical protein